MPTAESLPTTEPAVTNSGEPSVLHVVLSLDCGGLEHVVVQLCERAREEGRRVGVVCLEREGDLATQATATGATVTCLDKKPGLQWSLRGRLRRLLAEWRPDVVHTHQIGALFYAGPAAKRLGVPTVHTEHGKHYGKSLKLRVLARYAAKHCDRYVGVAPDVTQHAIDHKITRRPKTASIVNGVDVDRFDAARDAIESTRNSLGIPQTSRIVGTVGRLEEVKNYRLLLRAFARVAAELDAAWLLFVGDGSQSNVLRSLAIELGVADRVHFAGYHNDTAPLVAAMDAFCLTSDSEGLPLSLLEAMAARTPVAVSAVGGIPGVVRDGENGLLIPRGDENRAAEAIRRVLTESPLADRLSGAAYRDVRQSYSFDSMANAYASLYREVAAAR